MNKKEMSNTILLLALLFSGIASAAAEDTNNMCKSLSEAAEATMMARQSGTAMSTLMETTVEPTSPVTKYARNIFEEQIKEAYDTPRYQSPQMIQRTIEDFRDKWYLKCIKTASPKGR